MAKRGDFIAWIVVTLVLLASLALAGCDHPHSSSAQNLFRDEGLGIEFKYPASWMEGAPPSPYSSCFGCTVVGPAEVAHSYGIQLFNESLSKGCGVTCYVGNRALPGGEERSLTVGGRDASQVEIERQAPLGLVDQTSDDTPYREKWTLIPLEDRALFLVAFYRFGDTTAEVETESAYGGLLASLVILPQPTLPGTWLPTPAELMRLKPECGPAVRLAYLRPATTPTSRVCSAMTVQW